MNNTKRVLAALAELAQMGYTDGTLYEEGFNCMNLGDGALSAPRD